MTTQRPAEGLKSVVVLTPTLILRGGTQFQLLNLCRELQNQGVDCQICTFAYDPEATFMEFREVTVRSVVGSRGISFINILCRVLHVTPEAILLRSIPLLRRRLLSIVSPLRPQIINPHDWLSLWMASYLIKRGLPKARIVMMLNDMPPSALRPRKLRSRIMRLIDIVSSKRVDSIVVLDTRMMKLAQAYYQGIHVAVIRSGIDIPRIMSIRVDRSSIRSSLGIPMDHFVLACASVGSPHRRFEDVMQAVASLGEPNISVLIVSNLSAVPKYHKLLSRTAKDLELESRVHIVNGSLPLDERMQYIASADAFVFPNENQTWGLSVLEAMALGIPTLVSDGAGVSEVLTHLENALIHPVGRTDILAQNVRALLDSPPLRDRIVQDAHDLVSSFSWERYARDMRVQFENALHS